MSFPQPSNALTYLDIAASCSGMLIVKILDLQGRIAKTVKESVDNDGAYKVYINVNDLKKGMYVVNVFNNGNFLKAIRYVKR